MLVGILYQLHLTLVILTREVKVKRYHQSRKALTSHKLDSEDQIMILLLLKLTQQILKIVVEDQMSKIMVQALLLKSNKIEERLHWIIKKIQLINGYMLLEVNCIKNMTSQKSICHTKKQVNKQRLMTYPPCYFKNRKWQGIEIQTTRRLRKDPHSIIIICLRYVLTYL